MEKNNIKIALGVIGVIFCGIGLIKIIIEPKPEYLIHCCIGLAFSLISNMINQNEV